MDIHVLVGEIIDTRKLLKKAQEDKDTMGILLIESDLYKLYAAYGKFMFDGIVE